MFNPFISTLFLTTFINNFFYKKNTFYSIIINPKDANLKIVFKLNFNNI